MSFKNYYTAFHKLLIAALTLTPLTALGQQLNISGRVIDGSGEAVAGASVAVKGTATGAMTDPAGNYSISAASDAMLVFSFLGMGSKEEAVNGRTRIDVTLKESEHEIEEVVVHAGIIQRDRMGFTGSYVSVTKEELKSTGNINVIQSLKSFDPGFVIVENNLSGSDPNKLANIEVRGQTSMNITSVQAEAEASNNLPLFILDGFETTLQIINDLDVNRVESITILKDAGSTAIYGAKGANGVVVIETVKPKPGQVFVTYSGDFQLAMPDLTVYNMMNAAEKLEFERLSGRYAYSASSSKDPYAPVLDVNQGSYFAKLAKIQQGVNTYWLAEPVRTAFTQAHSAMVSGGEKELQYTAGLNYRANPGVMKGSERDTYGGSLILTYRGVKGLSINNNLAVSGTTAQDGAWGSFSDFVNANPYYTKRDEFGNVSKYLESVDYGISDNIFTVSAVNPLYNASLNSQQTSKLFAFSNGTAVDYRLNDDLLFRGSVNLRRTSTSSVNFVDPRHSQFDNLTYDRKGKYTSSQTTFWSYNANISANYLKSFQGHNFTLIARANIDETNNTRESIVAVGFPEGAIANPIYSYSYEPNSRPNYSDVKTRGVGAMGVFNYNYDYRYLLDINYNMEGSTNFGKKEHFQSFWSLGGGWNLHREPFARGWKWLGELKIRGTYGFNGNQNTTFVTSNVNSFYVGNDVFGQAAYMSAFGNQHLKWQVVEKVAAGIDLALLKSNLRINFDLYQHTTDPQIATLEQRPSSGVSSFAYNLGWLRSRGYEFRLSYNIINRTEDRFYINVRVTGGHNEAVYGGFGQALSNLNEAYKKDSYDPYSGSQYSLRSLEHFEDGKSPYDMWAVRSLGIDPSTGEEMFLTKDGKQTYIYSADDRIPMYSSRPVLEGVIGLSMRYKCLSVSANLRYYLGAYTFNTALFNKVENISNANIVYNQDKRALYDRWKEPGDISQFKGIALTNTYSTPLSTRFIQQNNYLRGESIKISWNFAGQRWLDAVKLKDLSISLSMSDIFNINSIQIERGTDYPFQRAVIMNMSLRF